MRSDMPKVITERPRYNSNYRKVKGFKKADAPKFDGDDYKSRPLRYGDFCTKEFTDLIGPLYRYLHKQVGRKWNDVWSEICETIPNGGVSLSHARDHVFDCVDIHNNGIQQRWQTLYVNESGILVKRPLKKRQKFNRNNHGKGIVIDGRRFHFRNGWFELTMASHNDKLRPTWKYWIYDCWLGRSVLDWHHQWDEYGQYIYCVAKRQLNKKEIRKLGLPKGA